MALTLSVGFVVDDAIVVLENIVRHMEMGKPRMEAALEGAKEIGFTILSMTLSLAAVFIPVLFMGGIVGRLFHEFAVTIMVAILISGFVSLSLTPMLCSRFLKPPSETSQRSLSRLGASFRWHARRLWLDAARRDAPPVHHAAGGALALWWPPCTLLADRAQGLHPEPGHGPVTRTTESGRTPRSTPWWNCSSKARQVVAARSRTSIVIRCPSWRAGSNSAHQSGRFIMRLKPRAERKLTPEQMIEEMRPKLDAIPGVRRYLTNPPLVRIGGTADRSSLSIHAAGAGSECTVPRRGGFREAHAARCRA